MVNSGGETRLVQMASSLHRSNHGLTKQEAEIQYIREASSADTSPLTHNSHLYRLKHKKQDVGSGNVLLSICTRGIQLYEVFYVLLNLFISCLNTLFLFLLISS